MSSTRILSCLAVLAACTGGAAPLGCESRSRQLSEVAPFRQASFPLGTQREYRLSLESRYGPEGAEPLFEMTLTGLVAVAPLAVTAERSEFVLELRDVQISAKQSGAPADKVERLTRELTKPYSFSLVRGRLEESRIHGDPNPLVVGVFRSLSALFQWSPPKGAENKWTANERDATGDYAAEYVRSATPAGFTKRKLRYDKLFSDLAQRLGTPAQVEAPKVVASTARIELRPDGPVTISHKETLDVSIAEGVALRSTTGIELALSRVIDAKTPDRNELEAGTRRLPATEAYAPRIKPNLDAAKIGGLKFEEVIVALTTQAKRRAQVSLNASENDQSLPPGQVKQSEAWLAEETRLFTALSAILRQQPDKRTQLEALIRRSSPAMTTFVSALGAAGSEACHALLVKLMLDPKVPEETKQACGYSLIGTKTPSATAVSVLERWLTDPNYEKLAMYGLGTFARLLRESGNASESKRLVGLLVARLSTATHERLQAELLNGISNSGEVAALDEVRSFLRARSSSVRRAAVGGVRLMDHPSVDGLIVDRLQNDPSYRVRAAALDALKNRTPSRHLGEATAATALTDASPGARQRAVKLMIRWLEDLPELRSTLEQVSKTEKEESIRKLASAALHG